MEASHCAGLSPGLATHQPLCTSEAQCPRLEATHHGRAPIPGSHWEARGLHGLVALDAPLRHLTGKQGRWDTTVQWPVCETGTQRTGVA